MDDDTPRRWGESMPEAYERGLADPVFRPFAVDLARRAADRSPQRVLELAAGTGVLTRELARTLPAADVTATDLSSAMVSFGRRRVPVAAWQEADATELPFDDATFDLVASAFGVMFFPDKRVAFAECRRVLRPDGTLLFSTWADLDTHDFQAALVAALRLVFPDDPPTFMESVPHGYADPGVVAADLAAAGMSGVAVESVTLQGRARCVDVAAAYCSGTPLRSEIEARGSLAATAADVAREMERCLGSGVVTAMMTANVFAAVPAR